MPKYGLKTLFIVISLAAVASWAFFANLRRTKEQAVLLASLRADKADIVYGFQVRQDPRGDDLIDFSAPPRVPGWLINHFGVDFFYRPYQVTIFSEPAGQLDKVAALPGVHSLKLFGGDKSLSFEGSLKKLTRLHLHSEFINDQNLEAIATLPNLQILELSANGIDEQGLIHIARIDSLKNLDLFSVPITDHGLEAIVSLRHLQILSIDVKRITRSGIDSIAKISSITNLYLNGAPISAKSLSPLSSLKNLSVLVVETQDFDIRSFDDIASLPKMEEIAVGRDLRDDEREYVQMKFPKVRFYRPPTPEELRGRLEAR